MTRRGPESSRPTASAQPQPDFATSNADPKLARFPTRESTPAPANPTPNFAFFQEGETSNGQDQAPARRPGAASRRRRRATTHGPRFPTWGAATVWTQSRAGSTALSNVGWLA